MISRRLSQIAKALFSSLLLFILVSSFLWIRVRLEENRVLKKVIERLSADSRIAEVLVTQSRYDEEHKRIETTIKFLEYDSQASPMVPRYFTFHGNIIQFQALVIRFQDALVRAGDKIRGKSAYLFIKVFVLNGAKTQEFDLTQANEIPQGYKVPGVKSEFEKKLWEEFWNYALNPKARGGNGIKNAQIEAPGSLFLPGTIYTLKIEHAGGIRIDAQPVPEILKGEAISPASN